MQPLARVCLFALGASYAVSPVGSAATAEPSPQSCPAGQIAVTRIDYEGHYNLSPMVDMFNLQALAPKVGYTRRTVLVANGYYKEASDGTILVVKDKPPGQPVPMPNITMYAQVLPSRFVIVETEKQRLVYDEQGDPEQLGRRTTKTKVSAAEERAIVSGLQPALDATAREQTKILGKASYAGIPCEVRQFLTPGSSVCVATVRGRFVTVAEEQHNPSRKQPSRMEAKTKSERCVSAREFEPPPNVRFK